MKKLKNSSKNNKFNVIILYGAPAVGKFTVARELQKLLDYKFFHNHYTHDLARQLFERGNKYGNEIIEQTRFIVFKEIAKAHLNVVTTHTYSSNFISTSGLSDPVYVKKVQSIIEKEGGRALFIHLIANEKEIVKRVSGESRKEYMKLRNKKIMKDFLDNNDWKTVAPVKNNLQIDNSNLSTKKVAKIIKEYFKL